MPGIALDIHEKTPSWAEGYTLIQFLSERIVRESKARMRRMIADGQIKVNGHAVNSSVSLKTKDLVSIPDTLNLDAPDAVELEVDVVFEDAGHLVIDKPAGWPVVPGHGRSDPELYDWMMMALNRSSPPEGPFTRPHVVHRLDRETSGVLLIAKDAEAASRLSGQFQRRTIQKQYIGLVEGVFPRDRCTVDMPLRKANRSAIAMEPAPEGGKDAVTDIEVVRRFAHLTLVRMRPRTGRQHQLRVHLAALGYPLAVDFLYGRRERLGQHEFENLIGKNAGDSDRAHVAVLERTPLHAESITYRPPSERAETTRSAPMPDDMCCLLDQLERYDRA